MKREDPELPIFGDEVDNSYTCDEDIEFDEIYGDEPRFLYDEDEDDDISNSDVLDYLIDELDTQRPFGFNFSREKMENFLKDRGYKIIKRYSDTTKTEYSVATKPGSSCIPQDDHSNIEDTFNDEVQDIILKWLLKIGKEE